MVIYRAKWWEQPLERIKDRYGEFSPIYESISKTFADIVWQQRKNRETRHLIALARSQQHEKLEEKLKDLTLEQIAQEYGKDSIIYQELAVYRKVYKS